MTKFIDPHTLVTGDSFEDSQITLKLVMAFNGERKVYEVPLTEAVAFDNAYDHFSSSYGHIDGREAVYYTR